MEFSFKEVIILVITLIFGGFAWRKISSSRKSGDVTQSGNVVNNGDLAGGDINKNIGKDE